MNEDNTPIISDESGRDIKGRFSTGNIGKPIGAKNKTTKDLHKFITNFLNEKAFEIPLIWNTLEDKDKATLFLHLSRLVMPKQTDEEQFASIVLKSVPLTLEELKARSKELDNEF